jgi:hypothetical protein
LATKANVYIELEPYSRLRSYIKHATGEVSGLGHVKEIDGRLVITKVVLFDQECSAGGTELDTTPIAEYIQQWMEEGGDPTELRLWWHSHAHTACFWSQTDRTTMEQMVGQTVPWFAYLVGNKANDWKGSVYGIATLPKCLGGTSAVEEEFDLTVLYPAMDVDEECAEEVKQKVRERKVVIPQTPFGPIGKSISANVSKDDYSSGLHPNTRKARDVEAALAKVAANCVDGEVIRIDRSTSKADAYKRGNPRNKGKKGKRRDSDDPFQTFLDKH